MKGAIRWMAQNHVAANLLMMLFVVGGLVMLRSIKQEIFPEVSLDAIQIQVPYPGASPEEIEDGIILKIEESLTGVDGIKEIRSEAREGMGVVLAVIEDSADPDIVLQDIKNEVDRIVTFPEDAEEPVISKLVNRREVISVVVYGDMGEKALREMAEEIRDELLEEPNITQVDLAGVRPYEVSIEIPEETLRALNLSLREVAERVRRASLDVPGGRIKAQGGEILIRTKEKRYTANEYKKIVLLTKDDGTALTLGEIAHVRDTFEDVDLFSRFNGKPAAMVKVFRVGEQKPLEISRTVKSFVQERSKSLAPGVHLAVWNDTSEILKERMNLLIRNACLGLILVFLVLGAFLEIGLALWVMLGIPISFLGAMFFMPSLGLSINMISLFAFIMALGIVVDDAIVVGESVYDHRSKGKSRLKAAIDGTLEVGVPVVFSVLTTIVAFIPLIFVTGVIGKFIRVIPIVVISIFVVSLIESLFVLPAHLSMGSVRRNSSGNGVHFYDKGRIWVSKGLDRIIWGPYKALLTMALEYRYVTCALSVAILLLVLGIIKGGIIKFTFMPEVESDIIRVFIQLPVGAPVEDTLKVQEFVVEKGLEAVAEFRKRVTNGTNILRGVYAVTGGTIPGGGPTGGSMHFGTHIANIRMALEPYDIRGFSTTELLNRWRELVGTIPGVDSITFKANLVHMGANIDVQLAHQDPEVLVKAKDRLKRALAAYPGVYNIEDTYAQGKQEFKVRIKAIGKVLGLTEESLGRELRAAFYGAEAVRLQRGRNEIKVMVRFPPSRRKSVYDLETMRIKTPAGGEVPLREVATIIPGRGYSIINRFDRKRVVDVTANVDKKRANAEDILEELRHGILRELEKDYPGLTYTMQGEERERRESMESMMSGFVLALFGIYALLAIVFKSYIQPVIIMLAIPFGIIGAILGHMIMGYNLSILSMFGIVALAGVVVNDSLLLVDRANNERRRGAPALGSLISAGTRRFRPILLTSLTTFFGLTPMILETSVQAQFLIPMAISLGFGILFATFITLLIIPAFYLVVEDLKSIF